MKENLILKKQSAAAVLKYAAVLLSALLAIWISGLFSDVTRAKNESLSFTPLLSDDSGWEFYRIENGSRRSLPREELLTLAPGRVFYLSRILTEEQENAGYTFLRLDIDRPWAVFLDGELFYTNCPGDAMQLDMAAFPADFAVTPPAPGEAVWCTIPAHYAGSRLTIATTHIHRYAGMPSIMLSSYAAEADNLITGIGRELIPAAVFAVITLFLSGIWLFALFHGIQDYPSLLLIAAALIQMLSRLRQFVFLSPVSYAVDSPLLLFIPAAELLLPLFWLLLQIKDRKNRLLFGAILGVSAVISLIPPIGGLFGGLPFYSSFLEKRAILFFPLAALLFFAIREAVRKRNRIFTLLSAGLCMTACLTAALYIGSLRGEGYYAGQITNVFMSITAPVIEPFFHWSAVILLALTAALALYQMIQRIAGLRTTLALQTERTKQLDSRLSAQKEFYEAQLAHEDALRSLRHDMAGHLNTLTLLLDDNKTAEAKKYLDGIAEYHKEHTAKLFSQNPYLNAVLQNYAAKCQQQHIRLSCHIGTGERELPATEVCLILNNALENAVEASLRMPEEERIIKVQASIRQDLFLLRVSNRFDGQLTVADGLPVSAKEGKEHGYGLSNIRQAAGRRNGSMQYRVQDGYFILDVALEAD